MTLIVRSATVSGATTKGSGLTHAEMDANWNHVANFTPPGNGAIAEAVSTALRRLPHSSQYSTEANFNSAVDGLSGTTGMRHARIGTSSAGGTFSFPSRTAGRGGYFFGANDMTFTAVVDPVFRIGYNIDNVGAAVVAGEPTLFWAMEGNYNDSSGDNKMETYCQFDGLTGQGSETRRPIFVQANRDTAEIQVISGCDIFQFVSSDYVTNVLDVRNTIVTFYTTAEMIGLGVNGGLSLTGNSQQVTLTPRFGATTLPAIVTGTGIAFSIGTGGVEQVRVTYTASADRYLTLTGSNGGNPTIATSAGNLAFTPAVIVAAAAGSAIGIATSSSTALNLPASTTGVSSIRLAHGSAPSAPVNGDMWTTTAGLFVRIDGVTVGPLAA